MVNGDIVSAGDISTGNLAYIADASNTTGYTELFKFDCADSGSNSLSGLSSGNMTMIVAAKVNNPPDTVGDNTLPPVDYGDSVVFNSAMFTTQTTPAYNDPEGDAPKSIKILSLPAEGTLLYNGSAVSVGQEITVSELDSDYLVWTPSNGASTSGYQLTFDFSVSDVGSGQYTT